MFNKKKYTEKEYKNLSLVYFIISGFLFIGYIIAFFVEGEFDKSIFYSLPLFVLSSFAGFLLRTKANKKPIENLSNNP
jgi:Na+/glutamate symporter